MVFDVAWPSVRLLEHDSVAGLINDVATDRAADVRPENNPSTVYRVNAVALDGKRGSEAGTILAVESGSLPTAIACCVADDGTAQLSRRRVDGSEIDDAAQRNRFAQEESSA